MISALVYSFYSYIPAKRNYSNGHFKNDFCSLSTFQK